MTCHAHGWKNLAPFSWNDQTKSINFGIFLSDIPVDISGKQIDSTIKIRLSSHKQLSQIQIEKSKKIVIRALSLNTDTTGLLRIAEKINPDIANLVRGGAGRLLRSPSLWEDAAKTLFTTNCSWALTKRMCGAICSPIFSNATPSSIYPFPLPQEIAVHSPETIKNLMPIGYRAEYFLALSENFAKDPFFENIESSGYTYKEAYSLVNKLKGFGEYGTNHVLVLCGYYDEIPIDSVVISYLKRNHRVRKPASFIDRTYRKWHQYKWWGLKLEKMLNHQNWLGD